MQGYTFKDEYCKTLVPSKAICKGNTIIFFTVMKAQDITFYEREKTVNALSAGILTQFSD